MIRNKIFPYFNYEIFILWKEQDIWELKDMNQDQSELGNRR